MRRLWIFIVQVILISVCSGQELSAQKKDSFLRAFADHFNRECGQEYLYEGGVIVNYETIVSNNLYYELIYIIIVERLSWMSYSIFYYHQGY